MSIGVSLFIIINAIRNLSEVAELFLEKVPNNINIAEIKKYIEGIDGIMDVHNVHIWSMDGKNNFATMHIITDINSHKIKDVIREKLREHNIFHVTIEIESSEENCHGRHCEIESNACLGHCHHHGKS